MSDPVTNSEIEDVLSSIRRLVSSDKRVDLAGTPKEERSRPVERLVLTAEQRVPEPTPQAETADEYSEDQIASGEEDEEFSAADTEDTDLWQDEAQFHTVRETLTPEADETGLQPSAEIEGDGPVTLTDDAPWSDPEATLYEAAGIENSAYGPDEFEYREQDADIRPLSDKIAALERVIARTGDQWEPDDPGTDEYAGTEVPIADWGDEPSPDEAEEPVREALEVETPAEDATPSDLTEEEAVDVIAEAAFELARDEAFLDEEALREMVADIVREELQGALGERITRNVRKLVRREIHRALTVQTLE